MAPEIDPLRCAGVSWRRTALSTVALAGRLLGSSVENCGPLGTLPVRRPASALAAAGCAPRGFLKYKQVLDKKIKR